MASTPAAHIGRAYLYVAITDQGKLVLGGKCPVYRLTVTGRDPDDVDRTCAPPLGQRVGGQFGDGSNDFTFGVLTCILGRSPVTHVCYGSLK